MAAAFIKYFSILFYSFFMYIKILNYKQLSALKVSASVFFASGLALLMFVLRQSIPNISFFIMILLSGAFMMLLTKTELDLGMTAMIISSGISFALWSVSSIGSAFFVRLILGSADNDILILIPAFFIQGLLANIPFRFRRLKRGFPFLKKKGAGSLGVFISTVLLCCIILLSASKDPDTIKLLPFLGIIICAAGIFFWWRNSLTKSYIEGLKAKELADAQKLITEKDEQIEELIKHNNFLSKVIHKDNKMIPAMEFAVREFLQVSMYKCDPAIQQQGKQILAQMENATKERAGLLSKYQMDHKKLPSTKIFSLDMLLEFMLNKAKEKHILFDLIVTGNIKFMVDRIIDENKLNTLAADLMENAIIAVGCSEYKKIIVTIGIAGDCYEISIADSGVAFTIETLHNLGLGQVTTHADEGGSGIGMMSTFEIMKETGASLIIEEYHPNPTSFSKRITLRFDGKNQYIIKSFRALTLQSFDRQDILIENTE